MIYNDSDDGAIQNRDKVPQMCIGWRGTKTIKYDVNIQVTYTDLWFIYIYV